MGYVVKLVIPIFLCSILLVVMQQIHATHNEVFLCDGTRGGWPVRWKDFGHHFESLTVDPLRSNCVPMPDLLWVKCGRGVPNRVLFLEHNISMLVKLSKYTAVLLFAIA